MRKKLSGEEGITLVELLVTTVILVLLGMMVNTGMQMATESYRRIIAQSELELMKSTVLDELADDLRFAWNVEPDLTASPDDVVDFIYSSPSFGENTTLDVDLNGDGEKAGHIKARSDYTEAEYGADPVEFLDTGVYGAVKAGESAYEVYDLHIHYEETDNTFDITLGVRTTDPHLELDSHTDNVTIKCLNPNT